MHLPARTAPRGAARAGGTATDGRRLQLSERLRNMRFMRQRDPSANLNASNPTPFHRRANHRQQPSHVTPPLPPSRSPVEPPPPTSTSTSAFTPHAITTPSASASVATAAATSADDEKWTYETDADVEHDVTIEGDSSSAPVVVIEDAFTFSPNPRDQSRPPTHCGRQSFGNFNAVVERRNRALLQKATPSSSPSIPNSTAAAATPTPAKTPVGSVANLPHGGLSNTDSNTERKDSSSFEVIDVDGLHDSANTLTATPSLPSVSPPRASGTASRMQKWQSRLGKRVRGGNAGSSLPVSRPNRKRQKRKNAASSLPK